MSETTLESAPVSEADVTKIKTKVANLLADFYDGANPEDDIAVHQRVATLGPNTSLVRRYSRPGDKVVQTTIRLGESFNTDGGKAIGVLKNRLSWSRGHVSYSPTYATFDASAQQIKNTLDK